MPQIEYGKNNIEYIPDGSKSRITIRQLDDGRLKLYDSKNGFEMIFYQIDTNNVIDVLKRIGSRELCNDVPMNYDSRFNKRVWSNHVNRYRITFIIEAINLYADPLRDIEIDKITKEKLKDASLYRLEAIHDAVEKKRKEKAQCLEQSLKELVN